MKAFWTNPRNFDDCRKIFVDIGLRLRTAPLNNLTATAAPTATDDRKKGYSVGSLWKYTTTGLVSLMTLDSDDNATWIDLPVTTHALLDGIIHSDTVADAVTRGSLIIGNSTPKWDEVVVGSDGQYLGTDGTDVAWQGLDIVDDTTPQSGGDFDMNGYDLTVGDNDINLEFNSSSVKTLTVKNDGAGDAKLVVTGDMSLGVAADVSDVKLTFLSAFTNGVITWDDNLNLFLFNHGVNVTGNIITDGTVDGRDVAADGTAQDSHIANTANPHATDIENLGSGTLAELNAAISDATLDDSGDSRTPSAHTVASHSDTSATGAELNTLTGGTDAGALHLHEGTAIKSTGEAGGSKFLREDGDGTCSWQATAGGDFIDDTTPQAGGDIDMNTFDIQFDDATGIRDDSDNEQLIFQKTGTAVTHFEMTNATTGNGPILGVAGETNVDLNILAKGTGILKLGVAGDIDLYAGVAYRFGPGTNKKAHLGSLTKKWDTGFFGGLLDANETGVRGAYYAAAISDPPTDAQLDSGVGAPASLGSGFTVMVKDTTSGNYWFIGTDGTGWYRTAALTVL